MGADVLGAHRCTGVRQLAEALERTGERTVVLNAEMVSQIPSGFWTFTLAHYFDPKIRC